MDHILNLFGHESLQPTQIDANVMPKNVLKAKIKNLEDRIANATKEHRPCIINAGGHFISVIEANKDKKGNLVLSLVDSMPDAQKHLGPSVIEMTLHELNSQKKKIDVYIEGYNPYL